jgi:hypothetical protein
MGGDFARPHVVVAKLSSVTGRSAGLPNLAGASRVVVGKDVVGNEVR